MKFRFAVVLIIFALTAVSCGKSKYASEFGDEYLVGSWKATIEGEKSGTEEYYTFYADKSFLHESKGESQFFSEGIWNLGSYADSPYFKHSDDIVGKYWVGLTSAHKSNGNTIYTGPLFIVESYDKYSFKVRVEDPPFDGYTMQLTRCKASK